MGTNLQLLGLGPDDFGGPELEGCNEWLVETRPDLVAQVHRSFYEAGCDVVETDTFGSTSVVLAEYGLGDQARDLTRRAAELACAVRDEFSTPEHPRWVAGSMGPGTKFPTLGHISYAEFRDAYEEQALGLLEGGVDLLLIETQFDLLSIKAAVNGARRAMVALGRQVPLQAQVTIELTGRMLPGTEVGAALTVLDAMQVDVVGLNCATGPVEMSEALRHLSSASRVPIACVPNAGLPSVVDGKMHYDLTPDDLADHLHRFVTEFGVSAVGGCCGTTPAHLAAVVARCADAVPAGADARARAGCGFHLHLRTLPPGHLFPRRRRAHQRQRLQGLPGGDAGGRLGHLRRHGPRPGQGGLPPDRRLRRLHGRRRCGGHDRGGQPALHPVQRAADGRLDRGPRGTGRAGVDRRPADPQLGQPRGG